MNGRVTPEMQAVLEGARRYEATLPDPFDFHPTVGRAINQVRGKYWNVDLLEMAQVTCTQVPPDVALTTERLNVISFTPPNAGSGAIVYVHGGGWAYSPLTFDEHFARSLAMEARLPVLAIDYGLAPERSFPRPVNDVVAAWRSILETPARYGIEPGPMVLAGDSAGANLALAAMLQERDAGRAMPAAAALLYGVYHYDPKSPSLLRFGDRYGPLAKHMSAFRDWYAPDPLARTTNPLAAPLLAPDHHLIDLPPLVLLAAEVDSLATDTELLAARLMALGRTDQVFIEPGVVHGFLQMGVYLEAARRCTKRVADAISTMIGR